MQKLTHFRFFELIKGCTEHAKFQLEIFELYLSEFKSFFTCLVMGGKVPYHENLKFLKRFSFNYGFLLKLIFL